MVLGLELHGTRSDSKTAASRRNILNEMAAGGEELVSIYTIYLTTLTNIQLIDVSRLQDIDIKWKGKVYKDDLPPEVCHDILRDIFFISFVTEFLLADHFLYVLKPEVVKTSAVEEGEVIDDLDATSREEQNIKVMAVIPGLNEGSEVLGFGSSDLELHQRTLYSFYWVMLEIFLS